MFFLPSPWGLFLSQAVSVAFFFLSLLLIHSLGVCLFAFFLSMCAKTCYSLWFVQAEEGPSSILPSLILRPLPPLSVYLPAQALPVRWAQGLPCMWHHGPQKLYYINTNSNTAIKVTWFMIENDTDAIYYTRKWLGTPLIYPLFHIMNSVLAILWKRIFDIRVLIGLFNFYRRGMLAYSLEDSYYYYYFCLSKLGLAGDFPVLIN